MNSSSDHPVMEKVRKALNRTPGAARTVPTPPTIDESIVRMVGTDAKLPELFAERAKGLSMKVDRITPQEVIARIIEFLRSHNCRQIALADSALLDRLGVFDALTKAAFVVRRWPEITLDELYDDYDCAISDVHCAIAETGALVIKPSSKQGRGLTLVPMHHIAIVEQHQILPDQVDLMPKLAADPDRSNFILIAGPSKTADIEMTVVTGVHGPNVVQTFILP